MLIAARVLSAAQASTQALHFTSLYYNLLRLDYSKTLVPLQKFPVFLEFSLDVL